MAKRLSFLSPLSRWLWLACLSSLTSLVVLPEGILAQPVVACKPAEIRSQISKLAAKGSEKDTALQSLIQCGKLAIPDLIQAMQKHPEIGVKLGAADSLAKMGPPSVEQLTQLVTHSSETPEVRTLAIAALAQIAQTHPTTSVGIIQTLTERRLDNQENVLIRMTAARALETIGTPPPIEWPEQIKDWATKNSAVTIGLISVTGLGLLYLLILGLKPRCLLHLPGTLTIPNTQIELPSGLLLWLKYQPRVLDRWVADHLPQVQKQFLKKPTVSDRAIHIPIQIKLGSEVQQHLSAEQLQSTFNRTPATLLIWGEGGVGKTSLACQIARWGMGRTGG